MKLGMFISQNPDGTLVGCLKELHGVAMWAELNLS